MYVWCMRGVGVGGSLRSHPFSLSPSSTPASTRAAAAISRPRVTARRGASGVARHPLVDLLDPLLDGLEGVAVGVDAAPPPRPGEGGARVWEKRHYPGPLLGAGPVISWC